MSENANKILIGKIVAPQGIRGELRVQTYTSNSEDLQKLKLENQNIKFIRAAGQSVAIIKIDGVNDRTSAEQYRGTELFVLRENLPPLPKGEFYQTDLIGINVIGGGIVVAVHNFGAGDILELDNGEMVSFSGAKVDLERREIKL